MVPIRIFCNFAENNRQNIANMTTDNINQNEEQNEKELENTVDTENKKLRGNSSETNTDTHEPSQKISVELTKYKTLIDALGDRKKVRRVVLTIFFLGTLLFAGISAITVAIKRLYPYSDITTNGLGATTIKSEKKEVSYWLFNTATLWANSGIHVDKGDIITIRASGKSHTAIHHIIDNANNNQKAKYSDWVGSEGEIEERTNERDNTRRKYRLMPGQHAEALLMQIAPNDDHVDTPEEGDPENFYFIGKERQNIYINSNGTLHFAVNDIVLNRPTIAKMMWETICEKYKDGIDSKTISKIKNNCNDCKVLLTYLKDNNSRKIEELIEKDSNSRDAIKSIFDTIFKEEVKYASQVDLFLNPSHCPSNQSFLQAADAMRTLIQRECEKKSNLHIIDSIKEYCKDKNVEASFIEDVCHKKDFQIKLSDGIVKMDKIKIIYEALCKIEKDDLIPKIGKMKLGYTHEKGKDLVCELSYYYGDKQADNNNRKTVWFEDNIGSFLIVIEKTKK